jgi:enterochelin esterase-like enzyme
LKRQDILFIGIALSFAAGCVFHPAVQNSTSTPPIDNTSTPTLIPLTATPIPPTPTPNCRQLPGTISAQQFDSATLGKPLKFLLYLPPCYSQSSSIKFPVLYLLHGQTFTEDQWQRLGAVQAADNLIASNLQIIPFLMVMPYEQDNLAEPYDTHFGDALVTDLVPWVDSHYPTCSDRNCRAIAGLSRGAAWAVWIGLNHPAFFAVIGAHSLPPFVGDIYRLPTWLRAIPQDSHPQIYMDSGKNDPWLPDARHFEEVLTEFHIPITFTIYDGDHSETYWQAHMQEYISQLALFLSTQK